MEVNFRLPLTKSMFATWGFSAWCWVVGSLVGWLVSWLEFFFPLDIMDFVTLKVSFREAGIQRLYLNEQLSSFLNIRKMLSNVFTSVQLSSLKLEPSTAKLFSRGLGLCLRAELISQGVGCNSKQQLCVDLEKRSLLTVHFVLPNVTSGNQSSVNKTTIYQI